MDIIVQAHCEIEEVPVKDGEMGLHVGADDGTAGAGDRVPSYWLLQ